MQLSLGSDDFCAQKVLALAAYSGVNLSVTKGVSSEGLEKLHPQAKSMVLQTPKGPITQHNTIIRYIAELSPVCGLSGSSEFNAALVDQWLEFEWNEIDVALQALISILPGGSNDTLPADTKLRVEEKAKSQIPVAFAVLESHLEEKTFLVGERISAADISLTCTCSKLQSMGLFDNRTFPSCYRWFMTVKSQSKLAPFFATSSPSVTTTAVTPQTVNKWHRHRIRVKELLQHGASAIGKEVTVKGWIRTMRIGEKGQVLFVELSDGSTVRNIQLVMNKSTTTGMDDVAASGGVSASLSCTGDVVASPAKGQVIEIAVTSVKVLGPVYAGPNGEVGGKNYPLAKKQHGLEYLREIAHLRPRSRVFSCAMRMRHAMAYATHEFFNLHGFVYVHTPLITGADCEGAGEQFTVTTLLGAEPPLLKEIPTTADGRVDYTKEFFGRRTALTVSGQLNVETHACALSDVYTFGPTFRAENSHTSRHLAEFWMIEPEICFAELTDVASLAEDYVKHCTKYALEHCQDDLEFLENEYINGEKGLRQRLANVTTSDFVRITYTQMIEILQSDVAAGKVEFERYPSWGDDLGSEHERYVCEKVLDGVMLNLSYSACTCVCVCIMVTLYAM